MAAPPNVTTKAMTGRFLMNKNLSDGSDAILKLQGVSFLTRGAITMLPLQLLIKHTTDEAGVECIEVTQKLSGTFSSTGDRILNGQERGGDDEVFGHMTEKSGRVTVEEVTDEFLKNDWTQDTIDNGIILTESWSTPGKNSRKWRALQAWGFEMVNGGRQYVRRTAFTSSQRDHPIHTRFIYDYLGEN